MKMSNAANNVFMFVGGVLLGVFLLYVSASTAERGMSIIQSPLQLSAVAFIISFLLFACGPRDNPTVRRYGWLACGIALGAIAPFALLFFFMAG